MTNTESLDMMLRLYATADAAYHAVKEGHFPPPEPLAAFFMVVVKTMVALMEKAMQDDKVSTWEMEQRFNMVLAEMKRAHEAAMAEAASEETKH